MILSQHIFFFVTVSVFKFIYLFALPLSIPVLGGMGLRMVSRFLLFYSFKSRFSASVPPVQREKHQDRQQMGPRGPAVIV